MRLQVIDRNGIKYGDRVYQAGEEFDIEDTSRGKAWAAAFIVKNRARRFEPVLVGSPTPPPKPQAPAAPAPAPAPAAPEPSAPPPAFQPDEDAQPSVEHKDLLAEQDPNPEGANPTRRGRYARRDYRPEE